jgi:hypothetical protein
MKAYVLDYRQETQARTSVEAPQVAGGKTQHYQILLGRKPGWAFGALSIAKEEAAILNSFRVHIGDHACRFDVEEIKRGIFAIVCKDHPDQN